MLKKIRLILGMSIVALGILCSNYVEAKEATDKSSLQSALQDERTQSFIEKNHEKLDKIRKDYDQIKILIQGTGEIPFLAYKDEELCGVYPQMIELFSAITKIPCTIKDTKESLEDNYTQIANREVDLLFGITLPELDAVSKQTEFELTQEGLYLHALEGEIFQNTLILAVPKNHNYTKEQLPYAFWGTAMEYDSSINGTIMEGHTIEYHTYTELKKAFDKDEVQGLFIPDSKLKFELQINHQEYQGLDFSKMGAKEYYIDLRESGLLSEIVDQISVLYDQLYDEYYQVDNTWMNNDHGPCNRLFIRMVLYIGCICIVGVTVGLLFVIGWSYHTKKQFEKMLELIPKHDSKWEDVLFVNLRNKKIQSEFGFSFYGMSSHFQKKKLPLKELTRRTGFDFTKYYEYITSKHETEFVHEFELYIQGVRYHYVETGVISGKKIVSRICRK